ncbi:MAG: GTPase ObgE [Candidatus Paceibacterota bacterium]
MLVDELTIYAKAGDGGDGVVRWRREKFKPKGGPAGGNGGKGGDVYVRAVRDLNKLSHYTGNLRFVAQNGAAGSDASKYGKGSPDLYIDIPVGARVKDKTRDRVIELHEEGQTEKILRGGTGGLGNEYFKSSTNQAPQQATAGKEGEAGEFYIELLLTATVGLVGLPNAGKSTLLNNFTNASSAIGDYPFTTLEPHLGVFYGHAIADVPGLVAGAAAGKGLGHKFLRHLTRTTMLLHLVSLAEDDPVNNYYTIREELSNYEKSLAEKEEWIVLTKKDLVKQDIVNGILKLFDTNKNRVFVISCQTGEGTKELRDALAAHLKER